MWSIVDLNEKNANYIRFFQSLCLLNDDWFSGVVLFLFIYLDFIFNNNFVFQLRNSVRYVCVYFTKFFYIASRRTED